MEQELCVRLDSGLEVIVTVSVLISDDEMCYTKTANIQGPAWDDSRVLTADECVEAEFLAFQEMDERLSQREI